MILARKKAKVFSISFCDLALWSVGSQLSIKWNWHESYIKTFGDILCRRSESIDDRDLINEIVTLLTIHFDGSIELREPIIRKNIKGRLFKVYSGDVVFSKIDIRNGAIGLCPQNIENACVTSEFPIYSVNNKLANAKYIMLLLRTEYFKNILQSMISGTSGRKRIQPMQLEKIKIPIPPLPFQKKIVEYWEDAKRRIAELKNEIDLSEIQISKSIFRNAGIVFAATDLGSKVFSMPFSANDRWGVTFNRYDWDLKTLIKSEKYTTFPLEEYAWINPLTQIKLKPDDKVSFVPMENVDEKDGRIKKVDQREYRQVKSGYTSFQEGDVIWAKITPCMQNGKSVIASNLVNGIGFGSTEFHVIRSKDAGLLKNKYIHLILRLKEIRAAATRYFIGSAGQQRVPAEFLAKLHIPIPPADIQDKLVDEASKVRNEIENKRTEVLMFSEKAIKTIEQMILGNFKMD